MGRQPVNADGEFAQVPQTDAVICVGLCISDSFDLLSQSDEKHLSQLFSRAG